MVVVVMILFMMFFADPISAKTSRCTKRDRVVDVGVVLDANSKSGKMMIAAIEVACHDYYSKYKLELNPHYVNSNGDPGRALSSAEELIGREEVRVIVWLDAWREETVLSEISRQSRILIVSFANGEGSQSQIREHGDELEEFRRKFAKRFRQMYGAGRHKDFDLSINTLRAYDCMKAIARSFDGDNCEISTRKISEAEFMGLSGPINLQKAAGLQLLSRADPKIQEREADTRKGTRVLEMVATKKLFIGVPRRTPFNLFVREDKDEKTGKIKYVGFCIDVFHEALKLVDIRGFDYDFVPHDGTYDELVEKVYNKTYDGAVGDITILSKRSREAEFTQPFMESSLSMIVPAIRDPGKSFLFVKPFTPVMWAASGGVLLYTVFIVWALEHGHNKDFSGSPSQQISTAMWFTFSSLFFAHREQVHNTLSRIVLVMWFFVSLILTQSYTASLTSMLTLQNIEPSITTIEWLRANKAPVGCNNETFVCDYLVNALKFDRNDIVGITDTLSYGDHFKNQSISALFLENPYEKAFFTLYCKGYVNTPLSYRFGGFGFVFPKNSTLADPFSEAILELSEKGNLSTLQHDHFATSCIADGNNTSNIDKTPSLGIRSFWVLYALTIGTSTCCLVVSRIFFRKRHVYLQNQDSGIGGAPTEMKTLYGDQQKATGS